MKNEIKHSDYFIFEVLLIVAAIPEDLQLYIILVALIIIIRTRWAGKD